MKPFKEWTATDFVEFLKSMDKKTWIKIGVGSLITILFVVLIGIPAWVTRPALKRKLADIQSQIQMVETLTIKKPMLVREKKEAGEFIQKSKDRLFKSGETSLLLGTISKLAVESKVSVVASSPKESSEKFPAPFDAKYEASIYDFTIEGGYHEIAALLARIESNPKMFRIQDFKVLSNQVKGKETSQLASLAVAAISLKEGAAS